jgi:hypothetical protein
VTTEAVEPAFGARCSGFGVRLGNVLLLSNNPIRRGETRATDFLVFDAVLNFDHLDAGRKPRAE